MQLASPSHGENRGSSPLGSARYVKYLADLGATGEGLNQIFDQISFRGSALFVPHAENLSALKMTKASFELPLTRRGRSVVAPGRDARLEAARR